MVDLNIVGEFWFCENCGCDTDSARCQNCERLAEEKKEKSVLLEEWCETPCQYCGNHWYKLGHYACTSCGY